MCSSDLRIVYIIPHNLSDVELIKVKRKQVMNELIDRERRKQFSRKGGRTKRNKGKTKKSKRKSRKYKK